MRAWRSPPAGRTVAVGSGGPVAQYKAGGGRQAQAGAPAADPVDPAIAVVDADAMAPGLPLTQLAQPGIGEAPGSGLGHAQGADGAHGPGPQVAA